MISTAAALLRRARRPGATLIRPEPGSALTDPAEPEATSAWRRWGKRPGRRWSWSVGLATAFLVSRIAYMTAGVRFDDSALHPATATQVQWQLLPLGLLRHDLGRSVWNLHSQPPLYNLFCGFLLHLPAGLQKPVAEAVFAALGLVLVLTTFAILDAIGTGKGIAFALTLLVVADPSVVLYESWLSWSYPTAVLLTVGVFCVLRWISTGRSRWAAGAMACFASVVLLDATFQWPWLLATGAVVLLGHLRSWRRCLAAMAVPLVLTAFWYAKDAVQFGTTATSSWLGMNLYQTTLEQAPPADLRALAQRGVLDGLAETTAFKPVAAYVPRFASLPKNGTPATVDLSSERGMPNYNNTVYLQVSGKYLHDDLSYIQARPGRYTWVVTIAAQVWAIPADQYGWVKSDGSAIRPYARLYDAAVMLQPDHKGWHASAAAELQGKRPPAGTISWTVAVVAALDLLVAPAVLFSRRRNRAWLVCGTVMWLTFAYSLLVTSLTEVGENMRFRFELGTIPLLLAAGTIIAMATTRRCAAAGSSTGP